MDRQSELDAGRHAMKFGFDAIRDQIGGQTIPNNVYGAYNFTGTGPQSSGQPYADFLLGIPTSTALSIPAPNSINAALCGASMRRISGN